MENPASHAIRPSIEINHELSPLAPLPSLGLHDRRDSDYSEKTTSSSTLDGHLPTRHGSIFAIGVIVALTVFGAGLAVAQHILNRKLDGRVVDHTLLSQAWASHLNTGLAYAVKTVLVVNIGFSLQQVLWYTVRRRFIPLGVLNGAIAITSNPSPFLHLGLYRYCIEVAVIAVISYIVPISAIFSPGSISVASEPVLSTIPCTVPGVNLASSNDGVSPWNVIGHSYNGPCPPLKSLGLRTLTAGQPLTYDSPCGANCSYTISFTGPSLSCAEVDIPATKIFGDANGDVFWDSKNVPANGKGVDIFYAVYQSDAIDKTSSDCPSGESPCNVRANATCTAYSTTFMVNVSHINNVQSFRVISSQKHNHLKSPNNGALSCEYDPCNKPNASFALLAIKDAVVNQLPGRINLNDMSDVLDLDTTLVYVSPKLVSVFNPSYISFQSMTKNLEDAMLNMSLSTLSMFTSNTSTTCTTFPYHQVFVYTPRVLWIPYAMALLLTVCCATAGIYAIISNGGADDSSLLTLLSRTRNNSLDDVIALPERKAVQVSLKYGILSQNGQPGLGVKGDFET